MFHFCRTFPFPGVHIMYLKPYVLLWGFVVSTTFFAYVFEIESKYCVSSAANKEKYVKIFLNILD